MKEYIGTYKMNNGCFLEIYKIKDILVDQNNVKISKKELEKFKKIN